MKKEMSESIRSQEMPMQSLNGITRKRVASAAVVMALATLYLLVVSCAGVNSMLGNAVLACLSMATFLFLFQELMGSTVSGGLKLLAGWTMGASLVFGWWHVLGVILGVFGASADVQRSFTIVPSLIAGVVVVSMILSHITTKVARAWHLKKD